MAGASPGPSINRGPTTIHGQPSQRRIVVAPLAGAMLAGALGGACLLRTPRLLHRLRRVKLCQAHG